LQNKKVVVIWKLLAQIATASFFSLPKPVGTLASVTATSSTAVDYSRAVNGLGLFQIIGLPAGTYTFTLTPVLPFLPVTQTNVVVTVGVVTDLGLVTV
jgi:hypothetical protein